MGEVFPYQHNLIAKHRWSKLDTSEPVISRWNGLPITASCLGAPVESNMPSDVDPFDAAFFNAPFWGPDKDPA
jgi:hypothetical protein